MARHAEEQPIRPSILDRLIDDDPASETDAPSTSRRQLRELRLAIRRDLDNLLNTRERCLSTPEELKELRDSILNYGLPDLASFNLASYEDKDVILRAVEDAIRHYEPRFKSISVTPSSATNPLERTLRFEIDAAVFADPEPEQVVYDSFVDPVARNVEVKA